MNERATVGTPGGSQCEEARAWMDRADPNGPAASPPLEIRDHLKTCRPCGLEAEALTVLRAELHQLPTDAMLDRDLWPGIEARLVASPRLVAPSVRAVPERRQTAAASPRPYFRSPYFWAAAAVLTVVSGIWALGLVPGQDGGPPPEPSRAAVEESERTTGTARVLPANNPDTPRASAAERRLARLDEQYSRAREDLEDAFAERRAELSPATLAVVERNLAIIEEAVADLQEVLAAEGATPDPALEHLLVAQYQRQIDLLRRVQELPPASRRPKLSRG